MLPVLCSVLNFQREMGLYIHKFISVLKAEKIDQSSKDVWARQRQRRICITHTRDKAFSEQVFLGYINEFCWCTLQRHSPPTIEHLKRLHTKQNIK